MLERFSFTKVFDLQNSSRSMFYKKFLSKKNIFWSNKFSFTNKNEVNEEEGLPVLERILKQLNRAGLKDLLFTKKPDLSWAIKNIQNLINQNFEGKYILIFPFCSKRNLNKKWPYFKDLVKELKQLYKNKYSILVAPGVDEVDEAKSLNAKVVLNENNKPINLNYLITLIEKSSFVISNDTGPAHIASHLNKKGISLFGSHTSPEKISIKSEKFKTIVNENLKKLTVNTVLSEIKKNLN